jgi:hypothetical protein
MAWSIKMLRRLGIFADILVFLYLKVVDALFQSNDLVKKDSSNA